MKMTLKEVMDGMQGKFTEIDIKLWHDRRIKYNVSWKSLPACFNFFNNEMPGHLYFNNNAPVKVEKDKATIINRDFPRCKTILFFKQTSNVNLLHCFDHLAKL